MQALTDDDCARKLDEADRLLNDPDVPLQPALIWRLLAEGDCHVSCGHQSQSQHDSGLRRHSRRAGLRLAWISTEQIRLTSGAHHKLRKLGGDSFCGSEVTEFDSAIWCTDRPLRPLVPAKPPPRLFSA